MHDRRHQQYYHKRHHHHHQLHHHHHRNEHQHQHHHHQQQQKISTKKHQRLFWCSFEFKRTTKYGLIFFWIFPRPHEDDDDHNQRSMIKFECNSTQQEENMQNATNHFQPENIKHFQPQNQPENKTFPTSEKNFTQTLFFFKQQQISSFWDY